MWRRWWITCLKAKVGVQMPRRPRLTPGRLTALWVVLRTLSRFSGAAAAPSSLRILAARSSLRSGGLPIDDGYQLGLSAGFLTESAGPTTELGILGSLALRLGDEDEPNREVVRLFLSVLTFSYPPPWVAFWQGDPSSLTLVLPDPDQRLLERAELLPIPGPEDFTGWMWWKALARVPLPMETAGFRKAVGDAGEELSVEYERRRLTADGFPELARLIRWVGRESPAYGFDIASFWGRDPTGQGGAPREPTGPLAIEVKSIATPGGPRFPLYLSYHEWETARELHDRYLFHLWDGISPGPELRSHRERPMLVTPQEVAPHLPAAAPCSELCRWQTTYVELPLVI
jgi:hypothetical protein